MYGYQCYSATEQFLGWLYTYNQDQDLSFTKDRLDWCKRWKTLRGAEKNFSHYQKRWEVNSQGGYLKIEILPESSPDPYERQKRWQANNLDVSKQSKSKYDLKNPVWSFRPSLEVQKWLEEERWDNENGKPETNAELINRKLSKLMKLEQGGL